MKNFVVKFAALCCTILMLATVQSCKDDSAIIDPVITPVTIYKNDGPLSTVTRVCDVLCFTDESHFQAVYQYLEARYDANEPQDSSACLDAFEDVLNFTSRRTYVNDWEENMENQGSSIGASNDIDTLFFDDDIMKTLINPDGIFKVGNDAVLTLDECLWIRVPFNDCQGLSVLKELMSLLQLKDEGANDAIGQHIIQHNITFEDRCPSVAGSRSGGCGFRTDFEYTTPTLNPANNRYEFQLTDLTQDYYTNSQVRIWSIPNNPDSALFVFPGNIYDIRDFRKSAKISVPASATQITIRMKKRTLIPYCEEFTEKTIFFNCVYPDWNYVDEYNVQFFTRNAQPGTQVLWRFGDAANTSSTNLNPSFYYNVTCPDDFFVFFHVTGGGNSCQVEFPLLKITAGPAGFLKHKTGSGWEDTGSEKFKWSLTANGTPNILGLSLGYGKVKGKIKYKKKNNNGKWKKAKTTLTIAFKGNIYDGNSCSVLNDLAAVSSPLTKSNKKKMKHKYTTSTPFKIFVGDPVRADFSASGISGTFDVFD